jgi:hypothetical protein
METRRGDPSHQEFYQSLVKIRCALLSQFPIYSENLLAHRRLCLRSLSDLFSLFENPRLSFVPGAK